MRPPSIRLFEKLYLLTIGLGLVGLALSWDSMIGLAQARSGAAESTAAGVVVGAAVFGVLIPLLLVYFIARRASNIAKWIFVVLTAFGLLSFLAAVTRPELPKDMLLALNAVSLVLSLYCAWLLFRPDARAWLDSRGGAAGADGAVD
jgi:nitrate/nitrite transporter NarK